VWEAIVAGGLPANVHVHTAPSPVAIAPGVTLLPAPLAAKSTSRDPTEWMDRASTPPGTLRIGLAHGSVQGFGSAGEAKVRIDASRAKSAGLAYLALGDWHGTVRISERTWYSGTPEPDGFCDNEPGHALFVLIDGPSAAPKVERLPTAHFTWARRCQNVGGEVGLEAIAQEVGRLGSAASRHLIELQLKGLTTLSEFARIEEQLFKLALQLFHIRPDTSELHTQAAASDLEELSSGLLGAVARRLKAQADEGGEQAAPAVLALRRLFALARHEEAGGAP
jgi:hypothetical protein